MLENPLWILKLLSWEQRKKARLNFLFEYYFIVVLLFIYFYVVIEKADGQFIQMKAMKIFSAFVLVDLVYSACLLWSVVSYEDRGR